MKEQLCRAFCDNLQVREVPAGLAVSTAFAWQDGDRIGFYIVTDEESGTYRIEDSGLVLPFLRASGFNMRTAARENALAELLCDHGITRDKEEGTFAILNLTESDVPAAAMRFVAFLMRARDLLFLAEPRVATTFREDVERLLAEKIGDAATFERDKPIVPSLSHFVPDFVLRAPSRDPVGVYLGTSDSRVMQAVVVHMEAKYVLRVPCVIVAVIQHEKNISSEIRQQASNELDAVTYFRGREHEAVRRIAEEATGQIQTRLN